MDRRNFIGMFFSLVAACLVFARPLFASQPKTEAIPAKSQPRKFRLILAKVGEKTAYGDILSPEAMTLFVQQFNQMTEGSMLGELVESHPHRAIVWLSGVSHKVNVLRFRGDELYADITVLDTPCGKVIQSLREAKVNLRGAPRIIGSESSIKLVTIDILAHA